MQLDEKEMFKILGRDNPEQLSEFGKIDSELSIFDFFRESIILCYCQQGHLSKEEDNQPQEEIETEFINKQLQGFKHYLMSGESLELVDGENLRIHDQELIFLMSKYIEQLKVDADDKPITMFIIT